MTNILYFIFPYHHLKNGILILLLSGDNLYLYRKKHILQIRIILVSKNKRSQEFRMSVVQVRGNVYHVSSACDATRANWISSFTLLHKRQKAGDIGSFCVAELKNPF